MAVDDIETDTELLIGYLDSDMEADEDEQPPPAKREEEGEGARGPGTPGSAGAPSRRGAEGVGAAGGARSGLLAELARSAPLSGAGGVPAFLPAGRVCWAWVTGVPRTTKVTGSSSLSLGRRVERA